MLGTRLHGLFEPAAVAVIGVSRDPQGVGRQVFENLRSGGYRGALYAVNPKLSLRPLRVHRSIATLPTGIDLAVIALPAAAVEGALRQCGERGVRFAIVLSAGFSDSGDAARQLQNSAIAAAHESGVRVLGPNCLGLMRAPAALNASFSRGLSFPGKLALVSQSGAVCSAIVDWANARKIGFSTVVSLGAAADLGIGDVLDYLALDPHTDAVLLHLEGVDHARSFMSGLRAAARVKPVIVVKAGRHAAAQRAAASHTGAVIGNDAVFDAALRRAGAVRVGTLHELFAAAEALAHAPRSRGDRLAILTNAGGLGVLAVDRVSDLQLSLAPLSPETKQALQRLLPAHAAHDNPIDLLGDAPPERYRDALALCLSDATVDGVLVLLAPQLTTRPDEVAAAIARCERDAHKPVLVCFLGGEQVSAARAALVAAEVSCFDAPEAAVEAFSVLASHFRNQALLLQVPGPRGTPLPPDVRAARAIVEGALHDARTQLTQEESAALLRAFGISTPRSQRASDATAAARAAQALGFPVALKVDSPDITHKSDVDGVRLGLRDGAQVQAAFAEIMQQAARHAPHARVSGVLVQAMPPMRHARELLVGVVRDRALGPAIAFGAGGTLVELLGGAAVALPPLNALLAQDMLARAQAAPLLDAYRNLPAVDRDAVQRVLLQVSDLICELPEVVELDINPLAADAKGAVALDARIVIAPVSPLLAKPASRYAHLAIAPFPRELVRSVRVDGHDLTLRPIRPEDADLEQRFVHGLSTRTKYFRFLFGIPELTPEMLARFTQLDYDRELALVVVREAAAPPSALAIARYVADADGRGCEFAIVVTDAWQHKGLGRLLMTALIDAARDNGLSHMHGEVLGDNSAMLGLMQRLGFRVQPHPEDPHLRWVARDPL